MAIEWVLHVASKLDAEVKARASEVGESLTDFVRQAVRDRLDRLDQFRSHETGQPRPSRKSSRAGRSSTRRRRVWRCPVDWEIFDNLVDLAESLLEAEPTMERTALRHRLAAAVRKQQAQDPVEVVERALNKVLGRASAEFARPVPGNPLPPD